MFGKKEKLRDDLPAIDIRQKAVKGMLGRKKMVPRSKKEQWKMKVELMKQYLDRWYVDDLAEWNSVDKLRWIDHVEELLAMVED